MSDLNYYLMYSEFRRLVKNDSLSLALALRWVYNIKEENCFELVNLVSKGEPFEVSLLEKDESAKRENTSSDRAYWYWYYGGAGSGLMQEQNRQS